jgi:hypothetical protein
LDNEYKHFFCIYNLNICIGYKLLHGYKSSQSEENDERIIKLQSFQTWQHKIKQVKTGDLTLWGLVWTITTVTCMFSDLQHGHV